MFGKSKKSPADKNKDPAPVQELQRLAVAYSASTPDPTEAISCISSGVTIVGKIVGEGTVKIFGRVEGELHASTVMISNGAHVVGDIVADDLTIGGGVKGNVHANRVKLESSAIVEGDIYHRSLSIEENARFEGSSRREENVIGKPSGAQPNQPQSQVPAQAPAQVPVVVIEGGRKLNGASDDAEHAAAAAG
jgi:cytoskeletal protein CcmA (bactofilin family)